MSFSMKQMLAALSLGAMTLTGIAATPALAQPGHAKGKHGNPGHGRNDWKHGGKHDDRRDARRPGRVVYNYDWNRPDPRYGRNYRPDRYYHTGYDPIRVDRRTRIYRGYDNRYYCRRNDGTTGLIVGAALGGLLGNQIAQGQSNLLGTLIGGGAGALLGREIDRGGVSCR
ncbi:glycine zipper 2TM domain-containing protein [Sphingobium amiense]|uniref:17 kDa surface antigen n=1 Tax=Sphingobium amiense TaxID=135719 RepID=A0A494W7X9_9SPHN|nr:glycine zipper 2TM domain-containing protein [Sphingobium amiense]BBD99248.1 glycine zipper 2TM domain-containing protein [Sphingobium amiense]